MLNDTLFMDLAALASPYSSLFKGTFTKFHPAVMDVDLHLYSELDAVDFVVVFIFIFFQCHPL